MKSRADGSHGAHCQDVYAGFRTAYVHLSASSQHLINLMKAGTSDLVDACVDLNTTDAWAWSLRSDVTTSSKDMWTYKFLRYFVTPFYNCIICNTLARLEVNPVTTSISQLPLGPSSWSHPLLSLPIEVWLFPTHIKIGMFLSFCISVFSNCIKLDLLLNSL